MSLYKEKNNPLTRELVNGIIKNCKKKGFSLLELMIVIAIISIMTVVALVYISKSNRSGREVEFAAREVAVAIREAQNNALGGKQPDAGTVACGHGFYFDSSNLASYKIFYNPKGTDCDTAVKNHVNGTSVDYITYSLENGVQLSASGAGDIYFTSPHGIIYRNGSPLLITTFITVTKDSNNYNICVYPSGNVIESKNSC